MKLRKCISGLLVFFFFTNSVFAQVPLSISAVQTFADLKSPAADIHIPAEFGSIQRNSPGSGPMVIHIADAHAHYEAQLQIKNILDYLIRTYSIHLVGLEGASKTLHPGIFRLFSDKNVNASVVDALVKQGELSGAEFLAIQDESKNAPVWTGVEDKDLYLKDIAAFRSVWHQYEAKKDFFDKQKIEIAKLKMRVFSDELRKFDGAENQFADHKLSFIDYGRILQKAASLRLKLDLTNPIHQKDFPNLVRIAILSKIETNVQKQSAQIEKEKSILASKLKSFEWKSEGLDRRFFENLYGASRKNKVNLNQFPAFKQWAEYEILKSEIDAPGLFKEIESLEKRIYDALIRNNEERDLVNRSQSLCLNEKFVRLEVTRDEFEKFQFGGEKEIEPLVQEAKQFYALALKRESALLSNLLKTAKEKKLSKVVLVTGGFHTSGIEAILKSQKVSHVTVTPKISNEDKSGNYLHVILDKISAELPTGDLVGKNRLVRLLGTARSLGKPKKNQPQPMDSDMYVANLISGKGETPSAKSPKPERNKVYTVRDTDSQEDLDVILSDDRFSEIRIPNSMVLLKAYLRSQPGLVSSEKKGITYFVKISASSLGTVDFSGAPINQDVISKFTASAVGKEAARLELDGEKSEYPTPEGTLVPRFGYKDSVDGVLSKRAAENREAIKKWTADQKAKGRKVMLHFGIGGQGMSNSVQVDYWGEDRNNLVIVIDRLGTSMKQVFDDLAKRGYKPSEIVLDTSSKSGTTDETLIFYQAAFLELIKRLGAEKGIAEEAEALAKNFVSFFKEFNAGKEKADLFANVPEDAFNAAFNPVQRELLKEVFDHLVFSTSKNPRDSRLYALVEGMKKIAPIAAFDFSEYTGGRFTENCESALITDAWRGIDIDSMIQSLEPDAQNYLCEKGSEPDAKKHLSEKGNDPEVNSALKAAIATHLIDPSIIVVAVRSLNALSEALQKVQLFPESNGKNNQGAFVVPAVGEEELNEKVQKIFDQTGKAPLVILVDFPERKYEGLKPLSLNAELASKTPHLRYIKEDISPKSNARFALWFQEYTIRYGLINAAKWAVERGIQLEIPRVGAAGMNLPVINGEANLFWLLDPQNQPWVEAAKKALVHDLTSRQQGNQMTDGGMMVRYFPLEEKLKKGPYEDDYLQFSTSSSPIELEESGPQTLHNLGVKHASVMTSKLAAAVTEDSFLGAIHHVQILKQKIKDLAAQQFEAVKEKDEARAASIQKQIEDVHAQIKNEYKNARDFGKEKTKSEELEIAAKDLAVLMMLARQGKQPKLFSPIFYTSSPEADLLGEFFGFIYGIGTRDQHANFQHLLNGRNVTFNVLIDVVAPRKKVISDQDPITTYGLANGYLNGLYPAEVGRFFLEQEFRALTGRVGIDSINDNGNPVKDQRVQRDAAIFRIPDISTKEGLLTAFRLFARAQLLFEETLKAQQGKSTVEGKSLGASEIFEFLNQHPIVLLAVAAVAAGVTVLFAIQHNERNRAIKNFKFANAAEFDATNLKLDELRSTLRKNRVKGDDVFESGLFSLVNVARDAKELNRLIDLGIRLAGKGINPNKFFFYVIPKVYEQSRKFSDGDIDSILQAFGTAIEEFRGSKEEMDEVFNQKFQKLFWTNSSAQEIQAGVSIYLKSVTASSLGEGKAPSSESSRRLKIVDSLPVADDLKLIYAPGDPGATEVRATGGKGSNLVKMWRNGDPGKAFMVISPLDYRKHISEVTVPYKGRQIPIKNALYDLTMNLDASDGHARHEAERTINNWIYPKTDENAEPALSPELAQAIDTAYFEVTRQDITNRAKQLLRFLSAATDMKPERLAKLTGFADKINQKLEPTVTWEQWAESTKLQFNGTRALIGKLLSESPEQFNQATKFLDGIINDLNGVTIAVRSTGTLEDMPYAAFPGQYETYLNVQGRTQVRRMVLKDWASNYTERVISYRDVEILKEVARSFRTSEEEKSKHPEIYRKKQELLSEFKSHLQAEPKTQHLVRFFESFQDDPKSPVESNYSSFKLLYWLEAQVRSGWKNGEEILKTLRHFRTIFIHPDRVEMAVVHHKQSMGVDMDRPAIERTTAANVFAVDTTTGFTGKNFGIDQNGDPIRRSRILYCNSVYGWGEALVQGQVTADVDVYMAFDDENGKRHYVLLSQGLGDKAIWTASMADAEEALRDAVRAGDEELAQTIHTALDKAKKDERKSLNLPVPQSYRDKFVLLDSEKEKLIRVADRSNDIYQLRDLLKKLSTEERKELAGLMAQTQIAKEMKDVFESFVADPYATISPDMNPLGALWFYLYHKAPKDIKEKFVSKITPVVKDMEMSMPSELGVREPIVIQSRDFANTTDMDDPYIYKDERTIVDVDALKREGFRVTVHPNGFIEAEHPDGRRLEPLIGNASVAGIATSMAFTGKVRTLRRNIDLLPEEQVQMGPAGQKTEFLVTEETAPQDLRAMNKSLGVLALRGTKTSHAAIESLGLRIATVVGVQNFIDKLREEDPDRAQWVKEILDTDGIRITVDGNNGFAYLAESPVPALKLKVKRLKENGEADRAAELEALIGRFGYAKNHPDEQGTNGEIKPAELSTMQLKEKIDIKRLPRLRRKIGWIMSNFLDAFRSTKLGLSKILYSVALLRAEFSFGYVGIHPRAIIAHEVLALLEGEEAKNLTSAESKQLEFLRSWSVQDRRFWESLKKDAEILKQHPEIVEKIDRRIKGYIPEGWTRPSAIHFLKRTHFANVGSIATSYPWWQKKAYRFLDFKLREMKDLVGGDIFFKDIEEADSMVGVRGQTYLLSPENLPTYLLELETLASLMKNEIPVDPFFAFVRYPEQLEQSLKIAMEVFARYQVKPRSIGMMIEIPSNVIEVERYAKILSKYAKDYGFKPFFSYGTNDLTQGTFQAGRDVPSLHGIHIGTEVSEYTKKSPFVKLDPTDGKYVLRVFDEGRPEIYRSIYHVSRIAKDNGIELSLCGEALNKLSVQDPEAAAKIAANLDAGGSSVRNFLNVVNVFATSELKIGMFSEKMRAENKSRVIAAGKSSIKQGAADRTLVLVNDVNDLSSVAVGDFILLSKQGISKINAELGKKNEDVKKILERAGGFVLSASDVNPQFTEEIEKTFKKTAIFVDPEQRELLSKNNLSIVTIDFEHGEIYSGQIVPEERISTEPDVVEQRLERKIWNSDLSFLPIVRFDSGKIIEQLKIHPRALESVLHELRGEKFSSQNERVIRLIQKSGLAANRDQMKALFKKYPDDAELAAQIYEEYFYRNFRNFADENNRDRQRTLVFQMDNLTAGEYLDLEGGANYETEEANPVLGLKGMLRYLKPEYQGMLRAQIRAAKRLRSEGRDVAFMVVEANIPELSAEMRRIFDQEVKDNELPLGILVMTPSQVVNLDEHLKVGKYDFVDIDTKELPFDAQLADANNQALKARTPEEALKNLGGAIARLTRSAVSEGRKGDKQIQIAVETSASSLGKAELDGFMAGIKDVTLSDLENNFEPNKRQLYRSLEDRLFGKPTLQKLVLAIAHALPEYFSRMYMDDDSLQEIPAKAEKLLSGPVAQLTQDLSEPIMREAEFLPEAKIGDEKQGIGFREIVLSPKLPFRPEGLVTTWTFMRESEMPEITHPLSEPEGFPWGNSVTMEEKYPQSLLNLDVKNISLERLHEFGTDRLLITLPELKALRGALYGYQAKHAPRSAASSLGEPEITLGAIKKLARKLKWKIDFEKSASKEDQAVRVEAKMPRLVVTLPQGKKTSGTEVMEAILSAPGIKDRPYFRPIVDTLLRVKERGLRASEEEMDVHGSSLGNVVFPDQLSNRPLLQALVILMAKQGDVRGFASSNKIALEKEINGLPEISLNYLALSGQIWISGLPDQNYGIVKTTIEHRDDDVVTLVQGLSGNIKESSPVVVHPHGSLRVNKGFKMPAGLEATQYHQLLTQSELEAIKTQLSKAASLGKAGKKRTLPKDYQFLTAEAYSLVAAFFGMGAQADRVLENLARNPVNRQAAKKNNVKNAAASSLGVQTKPSIVGLPLYFLAKSIPDSSGKIVPNERLAPPFIKVAPDTLLRGLMLGTEIQLKKDAFDHVLSPQTGSMLHMLLDEYYVPTDADRFPYGVPIALYQYLDHASRTTIFGVLFENGGVLPLDVVVQVKEGNAIAELRPGAYRFFGPGTGKDKTLEARLLEIQQSGTASSLGARRGKIRHINRISPEDMNVKYQALFTGNDGVRIKTLLVLSDWARKFPDKFHSGLVEKIWELSVSDPKVNIRDAAKAALEQIKTYNPALYSSVHASSLGKEKVEPKDHLELLDEEENATVYLADHKKPLHLIKTYSEAASLKHYLEIYRDREDISAPILEGLKSINRKKREVLAAVIMLQADSLTFYVFLLKDGSWFPLHHDKRLVEGKVIDVYERGKTRSEGPGTGAKKPILNRVEEIFESGTASSLGKKQQSLAKSYPMLIKAEWDSSRRRIETKIENDRIDDYVEIEPAIAAGLSQIREGEELAGVLKWVFSWQSDVQLEWVARTQRGFVKRNFFVILLQDGSWFPVHANDRLIKDKIEHEYERGRTREAGKGEPGTNTRQTPLERAQEIVNSGTASSLGTRAEMKLVNRPEFTIGYTYFNPEKPSSSNPDTLKLLHRIFYSDQSFSLDEFGSLLEKGESVAGIYKFVYQDGRQNDYGFLLNDGSVLPVLYGPTKTRSGILMLRRGEKRFEGPGTGKNKSVEERAYEMHQNGPDFIQEESHFKPSIVGNPYFWLRSDLKQVRRVDDITEKTTFHSTFAMGGNFRVSDFDSLLMPGEEPVAFYIFQKATNQGIVTEDVYGILLKDGSVLPFDIIKRINGGVRVSLHRGVKRREGAGTGVNKTIELRMEEIKKTGEASSLGKAKQKQTPRKGYQFLTLEAYSLVAAFFGTGAQADRVLKNLARNPIKRQAAKKNNVKNVDASSLGAVELVTDFVANHPVVIAAGVASILAIAAVVFLLKPESIKSSVKKIPYLDDMQRGVIEERIKKLELSFGKGNYFPYSLGWKYAVEAASSFEELSLYLDYGFISLEQNSVSPYLLYSTFLRKDNVLGNTLDEKREFIDAFMDLQKKGIDVLMFCDSTLPKIKKEAKDHAGRLKLMKKYGRSILIFEEFEKRSGIHLPEEFKNKTLDVVKTDSELALVMDALKKFEEGKKFFGMSDALIVLAEINKTTEEIIQDLKGLKLLVSHPQFPESAWWEQVDWNKLLFGMRVIMLREQKFEVLFSPELTDKEAWDKHIAEYHTYSPEEAKMRRAGTIARPQSLSVRAIKGSSLGVSEKNYQKVAQTGNVDDVKRFILKVIGELWLELNPDAASQGHADLNGFAPWYTASVSGNPKSGKGVQTLARMIEELQAAHWVRRIGETKKTVQSPKKSRETKAAKMAKKALFTEDGYSSVAETGDVSAMEIFIERFITQELNGRIINQADLHGFAPWYTKPVKGVSNPQMGKAIQSLKRMKEELVQAKWISVSAASLGSEAELVFPNPELVKKLVTDAQHPITILFHKDALQPGSPFVQLIFQLIQFTQRAGGFKTMSDAAQKGGIRLMIVMPNSKTAEQDVRNVINAIYLSSEGRVTLQREWFSVVTSFPYSQYPTFAIGPSAWLAPYKGPLQRMKMLVIPNAALQPDGNAALLTSKSLASTGAIAFNSIAPLRFCKELYEIAKEVDQAKREAAGSSLGSESAKKSDPKILDVFTKRMANKPRVEKLARLIASGDLNKTRAYLDELKRKSEEWSKFQKELKGLPNKEEATTHSFETGFLVKLDPLDIEGIIRFEGYKSEAQPPAKSAKYIDILRASKREKILNTIHDVKGWEAQYRLILTPSEFKALNPKASSLGTLEKEVLDRFVAQNFNFLTVKDAPIAVELKWLDGKSSESKIEIIYSPKTGQKNLWGYNPHFRQDKNVMWQWIEIKAINASPEDVLKAVVAKTELPEKVRTNFREFGEQHGIKFEAVAAASLGETVEAPKETEKKEETEPKPEEKIAVTSSDQIVVQPTATVMPEAKPYNPFDTLLADYQVPTGFKPRKDNPMNRTGVEGAVRGHLIDGRAEHAVQGRGILGRKTSGSHIIDGRAARVEASKTEDGQIKRNDNILGLLQKTPNRDRNILGRSLGTENAQQLISQIAAELGVNVDDNDVAIWTDALTAGKISEDNLRREIASRASQVSPVYTQPLDYGWGDVLEADGRSLGDVIGTIKELAGGIIGNEKFAAFRNFLYNLIFGAKLVASASEDTALKTFRDKHAKYVKNHPNGIYAKAYQQQQEIGVLATMSNLLTPGIKRKLKSDLKTFAVIVFTGPLRDLDAFKQEFAEVSDRVIIEPASLPEAGSVMNKILTGSALRKMAGNVKQTELARHTSVYASADILKDLKGLKLATRLVALHRAQLSEFNISEADFNLFASTVGFLIAKNGGYDALTDDIREGLSRPDSNNWVQFNLGLLGAKIAQLAQEFAGFQAVLKAA